MGEESLAGRSYAQVYRVSGRTDLRDFLVAAVERVGGEACTSAAPTAPRSTSGFKDPTTNE